MSRQVLTVPDIPNLSLQYLPLSGGALTGSLGVAVPLADWQSDYKTVQIAMGGALYAHIGYPQVGLAANLRYPTGGGTRYVANGMGATLLIGQDATFYFDVAPNGSAGGVATMQQLASLSTGGFDLNAGRINIGPRTAVGGGVNGSILLRDDTSANRWVMGIPGSAGAKDWFLYDMVKGSRISVSAAGTTTFTADAGSVAVATPGEIQWGGGAGKLSYSGGIPYIHGQTGGYTMLGSGISGGNCISVAPATHNAIHLGWGDRGWALVHSVGGVVQDSLAEDKQNFAVLSPTACVDSVLATDWLSFEYKPPEDVPERPEAIPEEEWVAQQEAVSLGRKQRGYALGSDQYKVGDLFGTADRKGAGTQSDLATVACALKFMIQTVNDLARRIGALEGRMPA